MCRNCILFVYLTYIIYSPETCLFRIKIIPKHSKNFKTSMVRVDEKDMFLLCQINMITYMIFICSLIDF